MLYISLTYVSPLIGAFFLILPRYKQNSVALQRGMEELGFNKLLSDDCGGYIITAYHYPDHPNFNFEDFYCRLSQLG
jgi:2-aminoethylphosphonate-pyruvate transaminase